MKSYHRIRYYLAYAVSFMILSAGDLVSTRLVLKTGVGSEANPLAPLDLKGMLVSELIFLCIGSLILWCSLQIGFREFSDTQSRTFRVFYKIQKGRAGYAMALLVSAGLLLWVKFYGALNNFLILGVGAGPYDLARGLAPNMSNEHFFWVFAVTSNIAFFAAGIITFYWTWKAKAYPSEQREQRH